MRKLIGILAIVIILQMAAVADAADQPLAVDALLMDSPPVRLASGVEHDDYGQFVAIAGDYAVVAAPNHVQPGSQVRGLAYVYRLENSQWTPSQQLVAGDPAQAGFFAQALAMSGDSLVVGASDPNGVIPGKVLVYVRAGASFVLQASLLPAVPSAGFGRSVAVDGDRIVVGDPVAEAASVFQRDGQDWTESARLVPGNPTGATRFGHAVAIESGLIAVGRPDFPSVNARKGAVHIFQLQQSSWTEVHAASLLDGGAHPTLGSAVVIGQGRVLAGAPGYAIAESEPGDRHSGAVFAFEASNPGWAQTRLLPSEMGFANATRFGFRLAFNGDQAFVADDFGTSKGRVVAFARGANGWVETQRIEMPALAPSAAFGRDIALSGNRLIVGNSNDAFPPTDAAHIFEGTPASVPQVSVQLTPARVQDCNFPTRPISLSWISDGARCRAVPASVDANSDWSGASCGHASATCPQPRDFSVLEASATQFSSAFAFLSNIGEESGRPLSIECTNAAGGSSRASIGLVVFKGPVGQCPATPSFQLGGFPSWIALPNGTFRASLVLLNPLAQPVIARAGPGVLGTAQARVEAGSVILTYAPFENQVRANPQFEDDFEVMLTDGSAVASRALDIAVNLTLFKEGFE